MVTRWLHVESEREVPDHPGGFFRSDLLYQVELPVPKTSIRAEGVLFRS